MDEYWDIDGWVLKMGGVLYLISWIVYTGKSHMYGIVSNIELKKMLNVYR